jgi:hypothetical protein
MKFMIPFLIAILPLAAVAQSQSGVASGVPKVAIPKTTGVMVIQTAKHGVTPQQIIAVMPSEIRATVKLYFDGKIRQWYSRGDGKGVIFLVDAKTEDEARGHYGDAAAREGTVDGSRVHSRRTLDAAEGVDAGRSESVR